MKKAAGKLLSFLVFYVFLFIPLTVFAQESAGKDESAVVQKKTKGWDSIIDSVKGIVDFAMPPKVKTKAASETGERTKEKDTLDPVVVSATRLPSYERRLSNTPANVSVLRTDDIESSGAQTPQQAISVLEGVNIYDQVGNVVDSELNLRGFTNGEEVVTVVDGVRYNEPDTNSTRWQLINVDDLERIEVGRGSFSSAYGDGAFGGVVNMQSRRASDKLLSIRTKYEFGSHATQHFNGGVSGTIPDRWTALGGGFTYYFNGARKVSDGWRWNSRYKINDFDVKTGYRFFDDSGEIIFGLKRTDTDVGNPGELSWDEYTNNRRMSVKMSDGRRFGHTVLFMNAEKQFFDNRISTSWNVHRRLYDVVFVSTTRGQVTSASYQSFHNTGFTGQLTSNEKWKFIENHLTGGIDFDSYNENDKQDRWIGQPFFPPGIQAEGNIKKRALGIYFEESLGFFDKVIGTVGLRRDEINFKYVDHIRPVNNDNAKFHHTTAKVGVVFKPFSFCDLYGNYSEGFKSPGFSEYFNTLGFNAAGNAQVLQPETSKSYEIGARLRYKDRAGLKFCWYQIDLKNEILSDWVTNWNINVSRSRRYGVELSGETKPFSCLSLFATYTYCNAKLRSTFNDGFSVYESGKWINNVPQHRATGGAIFEPVKNLKFSIDGLIVGRRMPLGYENTAGSLSPEKGYIVFNSRASYQFRNLELFIDWKNMFDRRYYSRAVDYGTYYIEPAPPGEVYAGLKFDFE